MKKLLDQQKFEFWYGQWICMNFFLRMSHEGFLLLRPKKEYVFFFFPLGSNL